MTGSPFGEAADCRECEMFAIPNEVKAKGAVETTDSTGLGAAAHKLLACAFDAR